MDSPKLFFILIWLVTCSLLSSANNDSLKAEFYATNNYEEKLGIAYKIAKKTIFTNPDTATKYVFIAVKDSAKNLPSINLAKCLNLIGIYYFNNHLFDSTIYYSSRSYKIFMQNKDTAGSIAPRKNIGLAKRSKGAYNLALNDFFDILDFYVNEGKTQNAAATLNDIGNTYSYLEDNIQAIKYQFEALEYLKDTLNASLEGNIYNSLGFAFNGLGKTDSAIMYYEKSLALKQKSGNIYAIINTRNNLCTLIDYKKDPEKCEECLLELLIDTRKINDTRGLARTYLNLSVQYNYHNHCGKAISCLDSTGYYLSFSDDIFLKQRYFDLYAGTLYDCGKYRLAYIYKDSLSLLNDSIFAFQKQKELMDLDTKYQTQKKVESIKMLETENTNALLKVKNQRWQIVFLIFFIVTITGGGFLFFFYVKQRQKKQRELALIKMRENERVRIARDMHDEIGSGLTRISLISEQVKLANDFKNKANDGNISKIIKYSRQLSTNLKEIIWAIDPANDKITELLFYLRDYIYEFSTNTHIDCKIDFPDWVSGFEVSSEVRRNLFLALKEILNNIAKYADASAVIISFRLENDLGFLHVKDDGKGFDPAHVKKGVGLESIKSRAEKLGGNLKIESKLGNGTTIGLNQLILFTTKV